MKKNISWALPLQRRIWLLNAYGEDKERQGHVGTKLRIALKYILKYNIYVPQERDCGGRICSLGLYEYLRRRASRPAELILAFR
jgi:hypothetical protein